MEYKWYDIRKKIVNACKKTFTEQGISISGSNIEQATDLFDRIVSYRIDYPLVGNLQQDMQHSLQQVFVDNVGNSADLRNVLNLMDAFLKKIIVMAGIKTRAELEQGRPTLKPLLQFTSVSSTFTSITMKIDSSSISQFDKDPTGAYIFCKIYLARNDVHNSPEMDPEDVYRELRYAMSGYILLTHHLHNKVLKNYPNVALSAHMDLSEINETGYVYDFINYGSTSNKIRNRIVESFILNYVYKEGCLVSIETLVKEVLAFSRQSLSEGSIKSIIARLIPDKLSFVSSTKKEVMLNEEESKRIKIALDNYSILVGRLLTEIENLLDEYGLKDQTRNVYERLKKFFEDNCLSIIKILNEEDGEGSNLRSEEYIEEFKSFLESVGCPNEQLDDLFISLLKTCSLNDVLVRIALGKNFTNLSNPESFTSGLKQREKKVYLDTQLLLYALCDYDGLSPYNESPSFVIVKSLIDIARNNHSIHLATINQYVNEAAYHLKRAVQLITFDDLYYQSHIRLSDNVFYSYYYYLKENELLNEGMETLSDFLDELFNVSYIDLLQGNFESKNYSYLVDILSNDCGIEVEDTPYFSESDLNNSEKIFTTALLIRNDSRSPIAAKKDAIMGLYLFNNNLGNTSKPFFLSWDRAFYSYRKDFTKTYLRGDVTSWLLFSPAKFVNHLNLLDLKIDVDVMTEDLISIIEDEDTAANTKHVLDSIGRLLEKSNVTSRQKRKSYSEIIFNETEFPNDTVIPDEKRLKLTSDFAIAFDKMLTMMQTGNYNMGDFTDIISDEKQFRGIVSRMSKLVAEVGVEKAAMVAFDELAKTVNKTETT